MSQQSEKREAWRASLRPDHTKDPCYEARQNSHKCLEEQHYNQAACTTEFLAYRECKKKANKKRLGN